MKKSSLLRLCVLILFLFGATVFNSFAQEAQDPDYPIYASPSGVLSSIGVGNSVDYATGTLTANVALYTMKSGSITVPVSISYRATGCKVDDMSSRYGRVGGGWQLNAGGAITRIVKGKPDRIGTSEYCFNPSHIDVLNTIFYDDMDITQPHQYLDVDTEPDLYYFSVPGGSGVFFLDNYGTGYTMPYQNITIKLSCNASDTTFTIKDSQGTTYSFRTTERTRTKVSYTYSPSISPCYEPVKPSDESYISTWFLDDITTYQGKKVSFKYGSLSAVTQARDTYFYSFTPTDNLLLTWDLTKTTNTTYTTMVDSKYLSTIISDEETITFSGTPRLSDINVTRNGVSVKKLSFTYTNFIRKAFLGIGNDIYYYFLNAINEIYTSGASQNICSFVYYDPGIPPGSDSYDVDGWGYYNGAGNNGHYLNEKGYGWPKPVNRDPSLPHTLKNVLQKICSFGGGCIEYAYELHSDRWGFPDYGGLRIKSITSINSNGDSAVTKYKYDDPSMTQINKVSLAIDSASCYRPVFNYALGNAISSVPLNSVYDAKGNSIYYKFVSEIMPDDSRNLYEFTTRYNKKDEYRKNYIHRKLNAEVRTYDKDDEDYSLDIYEGLGILNGSVHWNLYGFPKNDKFWRTGLIKSMSNQKKDPVSGDYKTLKKVTYTYNFEENTNTPSDKKKIYGYPYSTSDKGILKLKKGGAFIGFIIGTYEYYYEYDRNTYMGQYYWDSEPVFVKRTETTGINIPYNTTEFMYDPIYLVPKTITSTDSESADGNVTETEMFYSTDTDYAPLYTYSTQHIKVPIPMDVTATAYPIQNFQINDIVVPIEQITTFKRSDETTNRVISGTINEYTAYTAEWLTGDNIKIVPKGQKVLLLETPVDRNAFTPSSVSGANFSCDSRYKSGNVYDSYGKGFNLLHQYNAMTVDDISYIYDPQGMYRIAEVKYAKSSERKLRENEVFHTSFENGEYGAMPTTWAKTGSKVFVGNSYTVDLSYFAPGDYVLTYWISTDSGKTWTKVTNSINTSTTSYTIQNSGAFIDELRLAPAKAFMKTYTYTPQGNILSETDDNGLTVYYEYDAFGRIACIMDNDRQVLKKYVYNIKQQ